MHSVYEFHEFSWICRFYQNSIFLRMHLNVSKMTNPKLILSLLLLITIIIIITSISFMNGDWKQEGKKTRLHKWKILAQGWWSTSAVLYFIDNIFYFYSTWSLFFKSLGIICKNWWIFSFFSLMDGIYSVHPRVVIQEHHPV